MSDQNNRVGNRQLLTAIEGMPAAIAAAIAETTAPVAIATPADETVGNDQTASVDAAYLSHMTAKLQARSNDDKQSYVLYARTNKANQTKLAYCVADKWSGLTDKRIIGPVRTVSPE